MLLSVVHTSMRSRNYVAIKNIFVEFNRNLRKNVLYAQVPLRYFIECFRFLVTKNLLGK